MIKWRRQYKAIRKHAITSVTGSGTPDERAAHYLIHARCRRIGDGTSQALLPGSEPSRGLLEPSCPESGHGRF